MKKNFAIKFVEYYDGQVFNVGEDGTKTAIDPLTRLSFVYGSAQNFKHCVRVKFTDTMGLEPPKKEFVKKYDKNNTVNDNSVKEKQDGVSTEIDITNPITVIFGAWNNEKKSVSVEVNDNNPKYGKVAMKAQVNFSEIKPIHPFLVYKTMKKGVVGVHNGDENSFISVKGDENGKTKKYYSVEELMKGQNITYEAAKSFLTNTRTMNTFFENEKSYGIYVKEASIPDMDKFGSVCLSDNVFSEEQINKVIENGGYKKKFGLKEYLFYDDEYRMEIFKGLIYSLFNYELMSNTSLHGAKPKLLRVQFTFDDVATYTQCTGVKITDFENKKAELRLIDDAEGVYTYNTLNLEDIYMNDGKINQPSLYAHKEAQDKIFELAEGIIFKK